MDQESKRGPVREAAGIVRRLGRLVRGRVKEFAEEKHEEAGQTLREVREELDEELDTLDKDKK